MSDSVFLQGWPQKIIRVDETGSTNTDAALRMAQGASPDFAIVADRQAEGRGQNGRRWQSPVGNLYLSAVLDPQIPAIRAGELAFVAANAVADTVTHFTRSENVRVKWPNDILIDNRKIAGILIENEIEQDWVRYSIIGIGINVQHAPALPLYPAECMARHRPVPDVNTVMDHTLSALRDELCLWLDSGFAPIRERWENRAWRIGKPVAVETPQGQVKGVMKGIDMNGALVVFSQRRDTAISSGSLAYRPN